MTSDFFFATCNEPTVGLWYVQENIRNVVPKIVDVKRKLKADAGIADSCTYGTDFTLSVVKSLHGMNTFAELVERVKDATRTTELILFALLEIHSLFFEVSASSHSPPQTENKGQMQSEGLLQGKETAIRFSSRHRHLLFERSSLKQRLFSL